MGQSLGLRVRLWTVNFSLRTSFPVKNHKNAARNYEARLSLGSITSHCSRNEPALERAVEIEPRFSRINHG